MLNICKTFGFAFLRPLCLFPTRNILRGNLERRERRPFFRFTLQRYEKILIRRIFFRQINFLYTKADVRESSTFLGTFKTVNLVNRSIAGILPENPFIIMYVNINRYLKIYLSNPPYTYITPVQTPRIDRLTKLTAQLLSRLKYVKRTFRF